MEAHVFLPDGWFMIKDVTEPLLTLEACRGLLKETQTNDPNGKIDSTGYNPLAASLKHQEMRKLIFPNCIRIW